MSSDARARDLTVRALRHPLRAAATARAALRREGAVRTYRKVGEVAPTRLWRGAQHAVLAAAAALPAFPGLARHGLLLQVVALWELGRREEALQLARRGTPLPPLTRARLVELFTVGAPQVAAELAAELDLRHPRAAAASGRLLEAGGHLHAALATVEEGLRAVPGDVALLASRERLAGELVVLEASSGDRPARFEAAGAKRVSPVVLGRQLHLLVSSFPYRQAGYSVRSHATAKALLAEGLDPQLVTRPGFPASVGVLGAPPVDVIDGVTYHRLAQGDPLRLPLDRFVDVAATLTTRLAEALRPAVLHPTSDFPNALVALRVREALGVPVVYEVRGFLEESWLSLAGPGARSSDRYRLHRAAETRCMHAADTVVTLAEVMKQQIVARGVPAEKVAVVPNAVAHERFRSDRGRGRALRSSWGMDPGDVLLGYVTSITAYEGLDTLLRSTTVLRRRGCRVSVVIVGEGPERAVLRELARQLGLGDRAIFPGHVPFAEVNACYDAIDVFVVPRRDDPVCRVVTPLKPFEAMAAGLPVVVSRLPPLVEVIDDGRVGLSFEPGDVEDLADVLQPLVEDPAARSNLGDRARAWVSEHRTWSGNARRYRELYERLGAA